MSIVDWPRMEYFELHSNCTHSMDLDTVERPPGSTSCSNVAKGNHKAVRFSSISVLHCFEAPTNQSGSTIKTWHSAEEEDAFKLQTKREIATFRKLKERGLFEMPTDMSPVGLEQELISREYTKKRIINKRLGKLAVRAEQARFVPFESLDNRQERIASVSRQHEWARTQAKTIGLFQVVKPKSHEQ